MEYLLTLTSGMSNAALAGAAAATFGLVIAGAAVLSARRQKRALARLDERITHLTAGVSLLANTTEDGLRGIATEVTRLAGATEQKPPAQTGVRQRIATAAGHGRSVQDIAASEQVSEGEVLLHLLLDKLRPEPQGADVC